MLDLVGCFHDAAHILHDGSVKTSCFNLVSEWRDITFLWLFVEEKMSQKIIKKKVSTRFD